MHTGGWRDLRPALGLVFGAAAGSVLAVALSGDGTLTGMATAIGAAVGLLVGVVARAFRR